MGRVSAETIEKLNDFISSLPEEAKSKCALCNETLVHIVKQAEVQTGAGTATVTRALSEEINTGAAPADVVSGSKLRDRVTQAERETNCGNPTDNNQEVQNRKPKKKNKPSVEDERVTEKFQGAYDKMVGAIQNERESGWSGMTKKTALRYADSLVQILTYGA